jgi:hypothetical protein
LLRSKKDGSFSLPFRFEAKMMAVFRFFFVLFSLRSIFVSLQISTFRIGAKQAKKARNTYNPFQLVNLLYISNSRKQKTFQLVYLLYIPPVCINAGQTVILQWDETEAHTGRPLKSSWATGKTGWELVPVKPEVWGAGSRVR